MYYYMTFLARVSLKLYNLFTHVVQVIPETGNDFHISFKLTVTDFFQEWWAQVTHGANNGGSFSEMMGPNI